MPHSNRYPLLILVGGLAMAGGATAQAADSVPVPGERVRVRWEAHRATGTLVEHSGNLLVVRSGHGDAPRRISLAVVERLEVWRCCTSRGSFMTGGLIGAGAVLVGGAIPQLVPTESANMAMAGAVLMTPVGFLVGGLIGKGAVGERPGWIDVPVPSAEPPGDERPERTRHPK